LGETLVNFAHLRANLHRVLWVMLRAHRGAAASRGPSADFEIERQWRAGPGTRVPSWIGPWRAVEETEALLLDRYFDTRDLQLAATRSRLRIRSTPAGDIATLKRRVANRGRLRHRIEIEGPCDADPERSVPFVAARLLTLDPLHEIGTIQTRRVNRLYRRGQRMVEVARDEIGYRSGPSEWRIEVEGDAADVAEVAQLLEVRVPGLAPVRRGKVQEMLSRRAAA
jgi:hypothetical protein